MRNKRLSLVVAIVLIFAGAGFTVAAEPIRVGAPLCLTGPYAGDGLGYLRGIQMAVDELNHAGGVLGRPLKLYKFDTQDFSPERVMQAAVNRYLAANKYTTLEGREIYFNQDHYMPISVWPTNHIQIQNGELVTLYLNAGNPYHPNKFITPRWIK